LNIGRGILVSSERLLAIIDDMLDLASIEAGKMSLELARSTARALVDEVAAVMQDMARCRTCASMPNTRRDADDRGRRAPAQTGAMHLVSNAIKFTPAGGSIKVAAQIDGDMTLLSSATRRRPSGRRIRPRVFEAFTRVRPDSEAGRRQALGAGSACRWSSISSSCMAGGCGSSRRPVAAPRSYARCPCAWPNSISSRCHGGGYGRLN